MFQKFVHLIPVENLSLSHRFPNNKLRLNKLESEKNSLTKKEEIELEEIEKTNQRIRDKNEIILITILQHFNIVDIAQFRQLSRWFDL